MRPTFDHHGEMTLTTNKGNKGSKARGGDTGELCSSSLCRTRHAVPPDPLSQPFEQCPCQSRPSQSRQAMSGRRPLWTANL